MVASVKNVKTENSCEWMQHGSGEICSIEVKSLAECMDMRMNSIVCCRHGLLASYRECLCLGTCFILGAASAQT